MWEGLGQRTERSASPLTHHALDWVLLCWCVRPGYGLQCRPQPVQQLPKKPGFDREKGQSGASRLFLFCPDPGRFHLSLQIGQVRPCRGLYPVVHSEADSRAEGQQPLTIVCTLAGSLCKGGANQAGWSQSGHGVRLVPGLTVCVPTCTKPLTSLTAYPSIAEQHFSQHNPKLTARAVVACFILYPGFFTGCWTGCH